MITDGTRVADTKATTALGGHSGRRQHAHLTDGDTASPLVMYGARSKRSTVFRTRTGRAMHARAARLEAPSTHGSRFAWRSGMEPPQSLPCPRCGGESTHVPLLSQQMGIDHYHCRQCDHLWTVAPDRPSSERDGS